MGANDKNYINKPVLFKKNVAADMELLEWLQRHLKQGEFTQMTKEYWMAKMKEEQK